MAIEYVSAATPYGATGLGTSFTLNKPDGAAEGDVLIAVVAGWPNAAQRTLSASGWTQVDQVYRASGSEYFQLTMLWRRVGSSDPSSWTVTASGNIALRVAQVACYRNVQTVGATSSTRGSAYAVGGSSVTMPGLNVTVANSWQVIAGGYYSTTASYNVDCQTPRTRRGSIAEASTGSGAAQAAIFDTGALSIGTGQKRNVTRSAAWILGAGVNVLLTPVTGTPASGDYVGRLAKVSAAVEVEAHNDAEVDASLPGLSAEADGYGQPPEGEGDLGASLGPLAAAVEGGTDVIGSLSAPLTLRTQAVGETRFFGVRVVSVDADDRVIKVPPRAVTG